MEGWWKDQLGGVQERRTLIASGLWTWTAGDVTGMVLPLSWIRAGEGCRRTSRICMNHSKQEVPSGHSRGGAWRPLNIWAHQTKTSKENWTVVAGQLSQATYPSYTPVSWHSSNILFAVDQHIIILFYIMGFQHMLSNSKTHKQSINHCQGST